MENGDFEQGNKLKQEQMVFAQHYHHEATLAGDVLFNPMPEETFLGHCFLQDLYLHRSWIYLLEWAAHGDL